MDQAKKILTLLTPRQLATIVICAIAVVAGMVWFSSQQRERGLRPLYTSLSPEDANSIVQKLREGGVDYHVSENGTSVLVPEARVPELRLEMAGLGLPKTGRIGFEIFDKTNFGITDFAERVNYRRAVEGELERSVMALAEVQQARVHVSLPKESVFTDAQQNAKASVLVGLRPGARLSQQNVLAITNLVSSAVEGLSPEFISVVDMNGNLLSHPRRDSGTDSAQTTEAALEYRQAVEHDLVAKIGNTLEPLLGADKFRTGVSADVDMTSGEQSEESFDPAKSVMVTSQKTEDSNGTTRSSSGPTPPGMAAPPQQPATGAASATASSAPQQTAARPPGSTTSSTKRTENITYQSSRTIKHVKLPQGSIKKLSIAVLLDQGAKWEGQGKQMHRVVIPPDPEKLKAIQALVGTLVGLNPERGDQLTVEALPFDTSLNMELPSADSAPQQKKPEDPLSLEALKKKPALLYGGAGGVALLLGLVGFLVMRGKKNSAVAAVQAALPVVSAPVPGLTSGPMEIAQSPTRLPALMPSRSEVLLNQLQESGRKDPETWAGIVREWLAEEVH